MPERGGLPRDGAAAIGEDARLGELPDRRRQARDDRLAGDAAGRVASGARAGRGDAIIQPAGTADADGRAVTVR